MGDLFQSLVFLNEFASPNDLVHKSHLTGSAAGHAMGFGEPGDDFPGISGFTTVKNPLPGHEYVIENDHRGLPLTKDRIAQFIEIVCHFPFCRVWGKLTDICDALRIGGSGKGHRIVLFPFPVRRLWQNKHFMACKSTADVDLGTPDNDSLLVLFHHFQGKIRVCPIQGFLVPPSSGFRQSAGNRKVLFLNHLEKFHKTWVISRTQITIHFPGSAGQGMKGIVAHTSIYAGSQPFGSECSCFSFPDKILSAGAHVSVAIDGTINNR